VYTGSRGQLAASLPGGVLGSLPWWRPWRGAAGLLDRAHEQTWQRTLHPACGAPGPPSRLRPRCTRRRPDLGRAHRQPARRPLCSAKRCWNSPP